MKKSKENYPSISKVVDELWAKWSLDGKIEVIRIEDLHAFYEDILEENKKHQLESLENNLILFDELLNWSMALAMLLCNHLSKETNTSPQLKACAVVAAAVCSHLWSIRILVTSGHDLPAKQVLRSLSEHFDILNLLWLKPELCNEFMDCETPEEANTFWYKHVSKGKLKKTTEKILFKQANKEESEAVRTWRDYRKEEKKILGMAAHPSSLACSMSALPSGTHPNSNIPGFLGKISESSIRTLQYAIHSSWEVVLNRTLPFGNIKNAKSSGNRLLDFEPNNPLHATVASGAQVINEIILLVSEWQDTNPHLNGKYGIYPWPDEDK